MRIITTSNDPSDSGRVQRSRRALVALSAIPLHMARLGSQNLGAAGPCTLNHNLGNKGTLTISDSKQCRDAVIYSDLRSALAPRKR